MRGSSPRTRLLAGITGVGVLGAGMVYVDRPVADYVARVLAGTPLAAWATRLLTPLQAVLVLALALACGAEGIRDRSKPSPPWLGMPSPARWRQGGADPLPEPLGGIDVYL